MLAEDACKERCRVREGLDEAWARSTTKPASGFDSTTPGTNAPLVPGFNLEAPAWLHLRRALHKKVPFQSEPVQREACGYFFVAPASLDFWCSRSGADRLVIPLHAVEPSDRPALDRAQTGPGLHILAAETRPPSTETGEKFFSLAGARKCPSAVAARRHDRGAHAARDHLSRFYTVASEVCHAATRNHHRQAGRTGVCLGSRDRSLEELYNTAFLLLGIQLDGPLDVDRDHADQGRGNVAVPRDLYLPSILPIALLL